MLKFYFGARFGIRTENMIMKKTIFLTAFALVVSWMCNAQTTNFEWQKELKKANATVKVIGELFVIVPDDNTNMRYISQQLPEEYKKDGLKVSFTGWEGIIPPNFRMMGKPLKLKTICAAKGGKKKYKLKKSCYKFK